MKQPLRHFFISTLTAILLAGFVPALVAQIPPHNALCPVMIGNRAKEKFFVDHEGMRIYLCCRSCVKAFKRNPQKYLKRMGPGPQGKGGVS